MDKLSAMRSFRRIVELGSFRAAALDRGLSNAGISKHLNTLEHDLGVALLTRTTRRLALTETGKAYFEHCIRILDDIDEVEANVIASHGVARGRLRVSAPMSFGQLRLMAWIPEFLRQHPQVQLDLVLDDRAIDLIGEGFDVAIRVRTSLADSSLKARRLGGMTRVLCASPRYLARFGTPAEPADLLEHRCLVYSLSESPTEWSLHSNTGGGVVQQRILPALTLNNSVAMRDAALAHLGIGLIPTFIVAEALASGDLVGVLPAYASEDHSLFAIYPASRHPSPKVRAFVDFLVCACSDDDPYLPRGAGAAALDTATASISKETSSA